MHLIIGGAYQGKEAYARKHFGLSEGEVFSCSRDILDFSRPCVRNIEEYIYGCLLREEDPVEVFRGRREEWDQCVLILTDISGGIVPMDKDDRRWREACGMLSRYLVQEAQTVTRIFCGLEQRLK